MPADAKLAPDVRCVEDAGHDGKHVVGLAIAGAVHYFRVDPEQRSARTVMLVDMRDCYVATDEETHALWAYMQFAASRRDSR